MSVGSTSSSLLRFSAAGVADPSATAAATATASDTVVATVADPRVGVWLRAFRSALEQPDVQLALRQPLKQSHQWTRTAAGEADHKTDSSELAQNGEDLWIDTSNRKPAIINGLFINFFRSNEKELGQLCFGATVAQNKSILMSTICEYALEDQDFPSSTVVGAVTISDPTQGEILFTAILHSAKQLATSCSEEDLLKFRDLFFHAIYQPDFEKLGKEEVDYVFRRCAAIAERFETGQNVRLDCKGLYVWLSSRALQIPSEITDLSKIEQYRKAHALIERNKPEELEKLILSGDLDVNAHFQLTNESQKGSLLAFALYNLNRVLRLTDVRGFKRKSNRNTNRGIQHDYEIIKLFLRAGGDINLRSVRMSFWNSALFFNTELFKLLAEHGMIFNSMTRDGFETSEESHAFVALSAITDPNLCPPLGVVSPIQERLVRTQSIALCVLHRMTATDAQLKEVYNQNLIAVDHEEIAPWGEAAAVTSGGRSSITFFGPNGLWVLAHKYLNESERKFNKDLIAAMQAVAPSPIVTSTESGAIVRRIAVASTAVSGSTLFDVMPLLQLIARYTLDRKAIADDYFQRFAVVRLRSSTVIG